MIFGPYSVEDWKMMLCIKEALKFYLNKDPERFKIAIKKDRDMLTDFINQKQCG
jgi:hypothetical protein